MFERIKPEQSFEKSPVQSEMSLEKRFGLLDEARKRIWRFSRVCVLLGSLMMPGVIKELPAQQREDLKIQVVENRAEKNKRLLRKKEYIVPQNVLSAYARVVDPRTFGLVAGGFFEYDYLNTKEKENLFINALETLGYSPEQSRNFRNLFKEGNIVFGEDAINSPDFISMLSHERMHKYIAELSPQELAELNEARDTILADYNRKRELWSADEEKLYEEYFKKHGDKFNLEDFELVKKRIAELINQHNPILWNGEARYEYAVLNVLANPNEFYAYLFGGGLNPEIESYIEEHFPQSAKVYRKLATRIKTELEEASKRE